MNLRDYTFLGTTRSLCPTCRRLVDAKIIVRDRRVYFRKRCPEHGTFEDFVCSDVARVLQLSGGEPTIHPDLLRMVRYAYDQPIAVVMINTNGIRLARDPRLVEALAPMRDRLEIYLQFDGLEDGTYRTLRGEDLLQTKLAALEALRRHDLRCTLVCTVDHRTNLHELGRIVRFGLERPFVRGVS